MQKSVDTSSIVSCFYRRNKRSSRCLTQNVSEEGKMINRKKDGESTLNPNQSTHADMMIQSIFDKKLI